MVWYEIIPLVLLFFIVVPLFPIYPAKKCHSDGNRTLVTFTFDDGYSCWITRVMPLLSQHEMVATAFITDPEYWEGFSWHDVQKLYGAGWEIGWHTTGHFRLDITEPSNMINDFDNSRVLFEAYGLPPPLTFAYPWARHDFSSMEIVSDYFTAARTGHYGTNSPCDISRNPTHLAAIRLGQGIEYIKKEVARYHGQEVLIVLLGHTVGPDAEWHSKPDMTVAEFEAVAKFLHQEVQSGNIDVVAFGEGVRRMQYIDATSSWGLQLDSPFDWWAKIYKIPVPGRYVILYEKIAQDFIGHRFPKVARLLDRVIYGPKHIGFYIIVCMMLFGIISIIITVTNYIK